MPIKIRACQEYKSLECMTYYWGEGVILIMRVLYLDLGMLAIFLNDRIAVTVR